MPQLLNMLATAPKEPQSSKTGQDSQSIESNRFSGVFADEKSKVDSPRASETPQKQMHADKRDTPEAKQDSSADKADANLILRQIKMGEDLEKGQNIAADGQELPLGDEDSALVNEEQLASLLSQQEGEAAKSAEDPSSWLWPVDVNVQDKELGEAEVALEDVDDDVEVLLPTNSKVELDSEKDSDKELAGDVESDADVLVTSAASIEAKAVANPTQDPKVVNDGSIDGKRDAAVQSQLAKANFTITSDGDSVQNDEASADADKKNNRILGATGVDGRAKILGESTSPVEPKLGDKAVLTKDQLTASAEGSVDKAIEKFGLKQTSEMSEKVAQFQTQQIARENGLGAPAETSSRESNLFSAPVLNANGTLTSAQGAAQTQVVQLSLRQGGEAPAQMQEMIQRFNPVMKQQLVTMVKNGIQQAEIRLDPPELGSMMVRIQVQGDQTQVQFQAAQSHTREMLEQALPKLRDMLSEQGMELTDGQVSQQDDSQQNSREESFEGNESAVAYDVNEISAEDLSLGTNQATSYTSGIDYYA